MRCATRDQIFVAYSHRDEKLLQELRRSIGLVELGDRVVVWSDQRIPAGRQWVNEIERALERAKVAVFLVTGDFLASPFVIDAEFPRLLQAAKSDGLQILWITAEASNYKLIEIAKFEAANDLNKPLNSLSAPERKIVWKQIGQRINDLFQPPTRGKPGEVGRPPAKPSLDVLRRQMRGAGIKKYVIHTHARKGVRFALRRSKKSIKPVPTKKPAAAKKTAALRKKSSAKASPKPAAKSQHKSKIMGHLMGNSAAKAKKIAKKKSAPRKKVGSAKRPSLATKSKSKSWRKGRSIDGVIGTNVPEGRLVDDVHFTLTGPSVLIAGRAHELRFWAHVEQQMAVVLAKASAAHGLPISEISAKSEGPYPLQRGSRLSVRLKIDGLRCLDSHKWLVWTGEVGVAAFVVSVPRAVSKDTYPGSASIRLNGLEIARMSFVVGVGPAKAAVDEIPSQTTTHRNAFASYASQDRAEVLSRVQGMETAYKGLDVFVDVVDLRSGQNWEQELGKRIAAADVFYLFWCRHAMNSEWVGKEWHSALETKGLDFIDPVPLEPPKFAPPPQQLATKHFNDPLLAFIAEAGGGHPQS